ncbi:hypothetical protein OHA25_15640 [Nonomuraea sp. NBC_00507]
MSSSRHTRCHLDDRIEEVWRGTLALTAAIWHNRHTGRPITRSLIAYDH